MALKPGWRNFQESLQPRDEADRFWLQMLAIGCLASAALLLVVLLSN